MSAEIIIIITGGILLLVALLGSIRSGDSSNGVLNTRVRVPSAIIGILLIIFGGFMYGNTNFPPQMEEVEVAGVRAVDYPVTKVLVTSPIEGDSVSCRILTMGVYPESHDKDIWVVLKPSDGMYYPQSDHTNTSYKRDGEWQVITRFGGDYGEKFELVVYEADSSATAFFSSVITSWNFENSYPGLAPDEIPVGAVEVDRISVIQKKNCRGVHSE